MKKGEENKKIPPKGIEISEKKQYTTITVYLHLNLARIEKMKRST
ncbi:hypothetical protein DSBG_2134 [Desulfosporosinus sp. BG]|nr:hypothetical protein DSBG_2134 [Desulfosporosinus sp. BG]